MRKYVVIDVVSSEALQIMKWEDDRNFPEDIIIEGGQQLITVDSETIIDLGDLYNETENVFYILDITDIEIEIADLRFQLEQLNIALSDFQEETWKALCIDETLLSQVWQDRLAEKRAIRARLIELG